MRSNPLPLVRWRTLSAWRGERCDKETNQCPNAKASLPIRIAWARRRGCHLSCPPDARLASKLAAVVSPCRGGRASNLPPFLPRTVEIVADQAGSPRLAAGRRGPRRNPGSARRFSSARPRGTCGIDSAASLTRGRTQVSPEEEPLLPASVTCPSVIVRQCYRAAVIRSR